MMRKMLNVIITIILGAVLLTGCTNQPVDPFADFTYEKIEKAIVTHPVTVRDFEIYEVVFARSVPKAKITHYLEDVTGYFKEYTVGLLDEVIEGDVVAVLDSGVLDIEIRDQKIKYEKSRLKYEKAKLNYETTGHDEFEMLSAKLDFDYEEYKYNKLLEQLEALEVRAEISGFITRTSANPGDFINGSIPLFDITDESEILISFESKYSRGIGMWDILEIEVRDSNEIINAEVIEIKGDEIIMRPDSVHSSFEKTGTLVYLRILKDKRLGALVIEDNSIISEAGRVVVYIYEDGNLSERDIKTGISDKGFVEVLFGLEEGEMVLSNPYN